MINLVQCQLVFLPKERWEQTVKCNSFKREINRVWRIQKCIHYCCRRQHTILNMKYCVYVCPVSLAELCIAERQLDFICNVRMFGCLDDQIYDVFWRHRNFTVKITYSRSRFDFPNTLVEPQAAQSYPVLLITLYLYINSILKIIRKSCVINLLRYIFI
jgi:hypothetical protein